MKIKAIKRIIPLVIALMLLAAFLIYTGDYYKAERVAIDCMNTRDNVLVIEDSNERISFIPNEIKAGFIFYPGGKVEYSAYAPLMRGLASNGILSIIVQEPFNLAVFNPNAAEGIVEKWGEVDKWYVGGHSLGGAMATHYINKNADNFEGVILMAAYANRDLSDKDIDALCIYGTCDKVLNLKKYEKAKKYLPNGYKEVIIEGGCHSWFGAYGLQRGDGSPTITREEQTEQTVQAICDMILEK